MNKSKYNQPHKQALKSALSTHYDTILKGTTMEKSTNKPTMTFRRWAIAGMALLLIVGTVAGVGLRSNPLTAQEVFAEAQAFYANPQERYVYQRAEIINTSNDPALSGEIIAERWYDTITGNERTITRDGSGQIVDESLTLDGQLYFSSESSAFDNLPGEDNILFQDNDPATGLPAAYEQIGFSSFDELFAADLSQEEEDDLFEAEGLGRPHQELLEDLPTEAVDGLAPEGFPTDDEFYRLKPSELDAFFSEFDSHNFSGPGNTELSLQEEYNACIASQQEFAQLSKLDIFYTGQATPDDYVDAFSELSRDDFFVIEEAERAGEDVFRITYETTSDIPGFGNEEIFLHRDTFSLAGIEADFGDIGGSFSMTITDEIYSDESFDLSTEGFESVPGFEVPEDMDIANIGFGCEEILQGSESSIPGFESLELGL